MKSLWTLTSRVGALVAVGTVCAVAGFTAGTRAQARRPMVVVPIEDARFTPSDPARPEGARIAVLRGDPATGPSDVLLELKKGGGAPHLHSADYHLVLLKGTAKHWADGSTEAATKPLGPGSYWFQPGNQAHSDTCLTDTCLMFITWDGKRDGRLVTPATR